MPRLLLVDDNPSIHKIAETLLIATDIELVCAASGAQALALIAKGTPFDVGMFDISMMGMDGWDLLAAVRAQEATSRMPVAMMAGVLDVVDPEKLRLAPIQGFLKKPVELRDLGDRVRHLLTMPVLPPVPEPVPEPIPEPEPEPEPVAEAAAEPEPEPDKFTTTPGFQLADHPNLEQRLQGIPEDLLILGPEDLYPGEPTVRTTEVPSTEAVEELAGLEEPLDLEELDLEGLRTLSGPEPSPEPIPVAEVPEEAPEDFLFQDSLAEPIPEPEPVAAEPIELEMQDTLDVTPEPEPQALAAEPALPVEAAPEDFDFQVTPDDLFPAAEAETEVRQAIASPAEETPAPEEVSTLEQPLEIPDFALGDADPVPVAEPAPAVDQAPEPVDLPDLYPGEPATAASLAQAAVDPDFLDWSEDSESLLTELTSAPAAFAEEPAAGVEEPADPQATGSMPLSDILDPTPTSLSLDELATEPGDESVPTLAALPAEPSPEPAPEAVPEPAPLPLVGADPLAALLADPVLMERLSKAVVARLGDQVLREIAWEVIPDLADRIQRN
jgi:CheY-like chemotaxis protein